MITGLSGSGKSSLVDTLYAKDSVDMQKVYLHARQFLGRLDKPKVDYMDRAAIAIEQKAILPIRVRPWELQQKFMTI